MMRDYFTHSPEAVELFKLWEFQINNSATAIDTLVLDTISYTIECTRIVGYRTIGTSITQSIIRNHMTTIYRNLSGGKNSLIQSTLRLLSIIVSQNVSITRELLDTFNFGLKNLPTFLRTRKTKVEPGVIIDDIRTLYIKFALGFLITGDAQVKKTILETKNFIPSIFKDLKNDSYDLIDFVLKIIRKDLVDDKNIPRTVVINFFNQSLLDQLLELYTKSNPNNPLMCSPTEPSTTISDLIHNFLRYISLQQGRGICYSDNGWQGFVSGADPSVKNTKQVNNFTLLKLIGNLKVSTDMKQRELLLEILSVCPELVHQFWTNSLHLSFEPRASVHYLANMALGTSIISLAVPQHFGTKVNEYNSIITPPPLKPTLSNILPSPLSRNVSTKALLFKSRDVRFACGKQLSVSFKKFEEVIQKAHESLEFVRQNAQLTVEEFEQLHTMWTKWEHQLTIDFRQQLPDSQIIISLSQSSNQEPEADDIVSQQDLSLSHLELLKYYQMYNSEQMRSYHYDFGKLITLDLKDRASEIQYSILELLQHVNDFKWWNKGANQTSTHFAVFLEMFVDTSDVELQHRLESLFESFFSPLFIFQGHQERMCVFWKSIRQFANDENIIIKFVEDLFVQYIKSPLVLVDLMLSAVSNGEGMIESKFPFPPVYVSIAHALKSSTYATTECAVWFSAYVMEDLADSSRTDGCESLSQFLSSQLPNVVTNQKNILDSLHRWLNYVNGSVGSHIAHDRSTLTWKEAKSKLKKSENFCEDLFSLDPSCFQGRVEDLLQKYPKYRMSIITFFQLNVDHVHSLIKPEHLDTLNVSRSWMLHHLFLDVTLIVGDLFESDTDSIIYCLKNRINDLLTDKSVPEFELKSIVGNILFWLHSWILRNRKSGFAITVGLEIILSILYKFEDRKDEMCAISLMVLNHPSIHLCFVPEAEDFTERVYNDILKIIDVCLNYNPASMNNFKTKLLSSLKRIIEEEDQPEISFIYLSSFQNFSAFIDENENESLLRLILKKDISKKSYRELLRYILASYQTIGVTVTKKYSISPTILKELLKKGLEWNDDELKCQIVTILNSSNIVIGFQAGDSSTRPVDFVFHTDKSLMKGLLKNPVDSNFDLICWMMKRSIPHSHWILNFMKEKKVVLEETEERKLVLVLSSLCLGTDFQSWNMDIPKLFQKKLTKLCKGMGKSEVIRFFNLIHTEGINQILTGLDTQVFMTLNFVLENSIISSLCAKLKVEVENMEKISHIVCTNYSKCFELLYNYSSTNDKFDLVSYAVLVLYNYYQTMKKASATSEVEILAENAQKRLLQSILAILEQDGKLLSNLSSKLTNAIFLSCLKFRFTDIPVLKFLTLLVQHCELKEPPSRLVMMVSTHSSFDSILVPIANDATSKQLIIPKFHLSRRYLFDFLYTIMVKDPVKCCVVDLLPKLVQNYHASLCKEDTSLLRIFHLYESKAHVSVTTYLYHWASRDTQSTIIQPGEKLNTIDQSWMASSLHWFPANRDSDNPEIYLPSEFIYSSKYSPGYDPSFFLPFLASLIHSNKHSLDAHRLVECNAIGMVVTALSSTSLQTRKMAHFILNEFFGLMNESNAKERNQVMLLLSNLRNSIVSTEADPFPVVPMVITSFVSQGLMILLKPESELYSLINRFCLQRPIIDLDDVPMFYELFYSVSNSSKKERIWILRLLVNGLSSSTDYQIYRRRHVLDLLLTFFQNPAADIVSRKLIFQYQLLYKASVIPSALSSMFTKSGLLGFLKSCCSKFTYNFNSDLSLALPLLIKRIFEGYTNTPSSWDGNVSRLHWINQFVEILNILLSKIETIDNQNTAWVKSFIYRCHSLVKSVVLYAKSQNFKVQIGLKQIFGTIDSLKIFKRNENGSGKPLDEFDIDQLFSVLDCNASDAKALVGDIIVNLQPSLPCENVQPESANEFYSILTWCLEEYENHQKLLEWILTIELNCNGIFKSIFNYSHKLYQNLMNVLIVNLDDVSNRNRQLSRSCLILFIKYLSDSKDLKRKHEQMELGISYLLNNHLGVTNDFVSFDYLSSIQDSVKYTPTPRYLLDVDSRDCSDSFHSLLLGNILKQTVDPSSISISHSLFKNVLNN
ncbi:ribosome 60S biogenesis N-terminal-domain-containing protein [Globomyces pollinis-pini]|nr:ribosome 60S biogenesis N-terminal-domain-containing protein [Globomyces pollinis-pini]